MKRRKKDKGERKGEKERPENGEERGRRHRREREIGRKNRD